MGTKKSYQKGYVTTRGKQWYGYFRKTVRNPASGEEESVRVSISLGLKSEVTKSQARVILEEEIVRQVGKKGTAIRVKNDDSVTFGWFVRERYIPLKEAAWKEETAKVKKIILQLDLIDPFEDIPLSKFEKFGLQLHLNKLASTRSKDRVLQIRAYVRDIFAEAVDQDFLTKDPARKLKVPAQLRETDKTTLSWDQLRSVLSDLPLRDRVVIELDMTLALRPSELFALKWRVFDQETSTLHIQETVYKNNLRQWGKTKKSLSSVPVSEELGADLLQWKEQCPDSNPEAFMFPNRDGGFMDTGNYRKRVLHKLAADLGLPKLTFQVIRRTIATLAQKKGTVKDVQGVMRHSRTATTTDVYMQEIPESVRATIDSISQELRKPAAENRGRELAPGSSPKRLNGATQSGTGGRALQKVTGHAEGNGSGRRRVS
jgi:integrase